MEKKITDTFDKALAFATKAHEGQVRKLGAEKGKPYIAHPMRVFNGVVELYWSEDFSSDPNDLEVVGAAAILHDVIEDGYINGVKVTAQTLLDEGFSQVIVDTVVALSRDKDGGETYFDFLMRTRQNFFAVFVKRADLADNLSDLPEGSLKDKYRLAAYILTQQIAGQPSERTCTWYRYDSTVVTNPHDDTQWSRLMVKNEFRFCPICGLRIEVVDDILTH